METPKERNLAPAIEATGGGADASIAREPERERAALAGEEQHHEAAQPAARVGGGRGLARGRPPLEQQRPSALPPVPQQAQAPPEHLALQVPHCPHELQLWLPKQYMILFGHPLEEQARSQLCVAPGVQTGAGAEQLPQPQLLVQVWLPQSLHTWVAPGAQTPPPPQLPHWQFDWQVVEPQLPQPAV